MHKTINENETTLQFSQQNVLYYTHYNSGTETKLGIAIMCV